MGSRPRRRRPPRGHYRCHLAHLQARYIFSDSAQGCIVCTQRARFSERTIVSRLIVWFACALSERIVPVCSQMDLVCRALHRHGHILRPFLICCHDWLRCGWFGPRELCGELSATVTSTPVCSNGDETCTFFSSAQCPFEGRDRLCDLDMLWWHLSRVELGRGLLMGVLRQCSFGGT